MTSTKKVSSQIGDGLIIAFRSEGMTFREIARRVNLTKDAVQRAVKKFERTGSITRLKGSGRPRKTTLREDILIVREVKKDRFIASRQIRRNLPQLNVTPRTIRRRIVESGIFKSCWAATKPFISKSARKKRFLWAKAHLNWTWNEWKNTLWSDESPFTLRFEGRKKVWRISNERFSPKCTVGKLKHDKRINVWGCFSPNGTGKIHRIVGNMNAKMYVKILDNELRPSI